MKIGELSALAGCPVETVRYYETEGLLQAANRGANNYRQYNQEHLDRLKFIRHCRSLDMALNDIRLLIRINEHGDREADQAHALVHKHIDTINERLSQLNALKHVLLALEQRCHGHEENRCGLMDGLRGESEKSA